MKKLILSLSLGMLATPALAEFPIGKLGINISPKAEASVDATPSGNGDGTAIGFYGELGSTMFFGYLDYQLSNLDIESVDVDVTENRIGLGARGSNDTGAIEVRVEQYDFEIEVSGDEAEDDGIGMHLGGELNLSDQASVFAGYGLLTLDDLDGPEMRLGIKFRPSDTAELYAAYRQTTLEDDAGDEMELSDFRLGANLLF